MSSQAIRFAVATSMVAALPLSAQTVEVLRQRVDSLRQQWQEANVLADLQDSLRLAKGTAGRDTIRVGGLTILANRSPLPIAEAAAHAWPIILRLYGPSAQAMVHRPIVIEAVDPDTSVPPPPPGRAVQLKWDSDTPALTRWLLNYVSGTATDRALREWLGGPLLFDTLAARHATQQAYIELVTRPSLAVRQCFRGNVGACRAALSVTDGADLLTRWYDPAERRALVAKSYWSAFANQRHRRVDLRACAEGDDSTCLDLLAALPPGHIQPPLDFSARLALAAIAVEMGGAGAMGRLLDAPERSMAVRLSDAARTNPDSLTHRWLRTVRAARPASVLVPPWGAWIALGWIGIFATCGLRSSRWRVN
jgi:hypothetical protein